jgi:signal transduction histidine kinase
VSFTEFKIGDQEIVPGKSKALDVPVWDAKEIRLSYNQNNFSFEFSAVSYTVAGARKYAFKLENYNDTWQYIGTDRKAYFFNVPPGKYVLHVKGVSADGAWGEKTIEIIITPPWWETWWFRVLSVLALIAVVYSIIKERSRKLKAENIRLEEKVAHRTAELKQSLDNLRSTQAQLIQSEKMASLGELTAGIAHEIQNPLNFVNNFSEVSSELVHEMKQELATGNLQPATEIANHIEQNLEKIIHHGKRADAIVKGMLQHSRTSTGQKELTNINALADEYLRLSYHGMRAKDKKFQCRNKNRF